MNGGYDDGYCQCPCFWGDKPGSLVTNFLERVNVAGLKVLDLGCGEGKNSAALVRAGASVVAIDCSKIAIENGKRAFSHLPIDWRVDDVLSFPVRDDSYDLVVMYGLAHCMPTVNEVSQLIWNAVQATRNGGYHLFVAFNDRSQDLQRAHPGFRPTLLPHLFYLQLYAEHKILSASDSILEEVHPHNGIPHHHSLTRLEVQIL